MSALNASFPAAAKFSLTAAAKFFLTKAATFSSSKKSSTTAIIVPAANPESAPTKRGSKNHISTQRH